MADANSKTNWVALVNRSNSGWPWPDDSWGLDPMYGSDGWCHGCAIPMREQNGPLTLESRGFPKSAVWTPNWRFDAICVSSEVADELTARFDIELRDVHRATTGSTEFKQVVPVHSSSDWYSHDNLANAVLARHSKYSGSNTGTTCVQCNRWKWLPITPRDALINIDSLPPSAHVASSHEVFGDGMSAFRLLAFRKELAEVLVAANPKTWNIEALSH